MTKKNAIVYFDSNGIALFAVWQTDKKKFFRVKTFNNPSNRSNTSLTKTLEEAIAFGLSGKEED